jgi:hypothetical protein
MIDACSSLRRGTRLAARAGLTEAGALEPLKRFTQIDDSGNQEELGLFTHTCRNNGAAKRQQG